MADEILVLQVRDDTLTRRDIGVETNDSDWAMRTKSPDTEALLQDLIDGSEVHARDTNNEQTTPLAANATWEGSFTRIDDTPHFEILYAATTPFTAQIIWSNDGVNPLGGSFGTSTIAQQVVSGYNVAYNVGEGRNIAPYYKLKIVNGADAQTAFPGFISITWLIKTAYSGSYGGLTAALNNLSRALLTRAVIAGTKPDGTFANVDLTEFDDLRVGFGAEPDTNNTTSTTLTAYSGSPYVPNVGGAPSVTNSDTWAGDWTPCKDFAGSSISVIAEVLGTGYAEFSNDAGATIAHFYTTPFVGSGDFAIPVGNFTHYRILFQNVSASTNDLSISSILHYQALQSFVFPVAGTISPSFPAALVKANITGQQPDGDFVNIRADGALLQNTTPLGAGATYTSAWFDTDGWAGVEILIATDQVSASDGILIEFTDDVSAGTPTVRATRKYTYTAADVTSGFFVARFNTQLDGLRVKYTNGGTPQGSFFLDVILRVQNTNPQSSLEATINATSVALMTRGLVVAKNASGTYGNIERGTAGGLDIGIVQHEVETPLKSLNGLQVRRTSVASAAVEVTSLSPLANRRSMSIKAICSGSAIIYIGHSNAVTAATGWPLSNDQSIDLEIDSTVAVWAIASTGTQAVSVMEAAAT